MGYVGVVFALFTLGYIVGVWTALLVVKQRQRAYEDADTAFSSDPPGIARHRVAATAVGSSGAATAAHSSLDAWAGPPL